MSLLRLHHGFSRVLGSAAARPLARFPSVSPPGKRCVSAYAARGGQLFGKQHHKALTLFQQPPTTTMLGNPSPLRLPLWNSSGAAVRMFASKKHKNLLKHCKGFRGRSKNCFSIAIRRLHKSWQYAYRDRRVKKRRWRRLWIIRIGAAVRQYSWRYSKFINHMGRTGIALNRKVLADLAVNEPFALKSVVDTVNALGPKEVAP